VAALKVTDVRINQKGGREGQATRGGKSPAFVPNFGFIVFDSTEAVQRAMSDKPIYLNGKHRLNVEEKKMRVPRKPGQYQDRRQDNHGSQVEGANLI
jgi:hypothetical protein